MSTKNNQGNKEKRGIVTRQKTQEDPELKKQIDDNNIRSYAFERRPKITRSPIKPTTNTYENLPGRSIQTINIENSELPNKQVAEITNGARKYNLENLASFSETQSNTQGLTNSLITFDENELNQNTVKVNTENSLTPKVKADILSPNNFHTPGQSPTNFDNSAISVDEKQHDYTDIEGILNEQSLISARSNFEDNNRTNIGLEENKNQNKNQIEVLINQNLTEFGNEMANHSLKLPLKKVIRLVPEFYGNNIAVEEYVEKLKQAKKIKSDEDEQSLVQI